MTYADAITLQAALEAALLSGGGTRSVTIGDRTISYSSTAEIRNALAEVNRNIQAFTRRANGQNPHWSRPKWT